jgi:non-heme chloroperoxidase
VSKQKPQDAKMTENLTLLTRRAALVSGVAAATVMALPTTFNLAANAASTISNQGDTEMAYITT